MDFKVWLEEQGHAPLTVEGYTRDVAMFQDWYMQRHGQQPGPGDLTRMDAREWLAEAGMPATRNRRLTGLHAWVRWGVGMGWLAADASPLRQVRMARQQPAGPRWLDRTNQGRLERELDLLANGARSNWGRAVALQDRALVALMAQAGLRVAEVCALALADVDVSERRGSVTVRHGKGDKARAVPLNALARQALGEWLGARPPIGEALFLGKRGEPLQPRGVQRRLASLGRRAGVDVTPHMLRHTFAKETLNAGAQLTEVQMLLGHARLTTTARYVRPDAQDLRRAVDRLTQ